MNTTKSQRMIAASIRDQILDMRLGFVTPTEWVRRAEAAEAQGVELDLVVRTRLAAMRGVANASALNR